MADWSSKVRPQEIMMRPPEPSPLDYYFSSLGKPAPQPTTMLPAEPPPRNWWNPYSTGPGIGSGVDIASAPIGPEMGSMAPSKPLYAGPPPKEWWNPYMTTPGIMSEPRPDPSYNVLSGDRTGNVRRRETAPATPPAMPPVAPGYWTPTSTMRPPAPEGPITPVAAEPTFEELLRSAQIDNLTSTGNAKPSDTSGLEAAAAKMVPNKWESLMRFGFGTAGSASPHFGVNVGAGGIAMLDARDQGLARYNTAMQNIAQLKETNRSNIQSERTGAIIAATPPAGRASTTNPVLNGIIDTQKEIWKTQAASINDINNIRYADPETGEELRAKDMAALQVEIANFFAALGQPSAASEVDLSDE